MGIGSSGWCRDGRGSDGERDNFSDLERKRTTFKISHGYRYDELDAHRIPDPASIDQFTSKTAAH